MRKVIGVVLVLAALGTVGWLVPDPVTDVRPESSFRAAEGSTIRLQPGSHEGFTISVPGVTVEAEPGAVVRGPVTVLADEVTLRNLRIEGGAAGVTVEDAEGVVLEEVVVTGADLHGIEIEDGSATITGCRISGLAHPMAQGIEVRNSSSRPRSVVRRCAVHGGQEGLVTHSSRVEFLDNSVTGTTMRAIAITEMSEGIMQENVVRDVLGSGLYCGDMSHCEIVGNVVRGVANDGSGIRSRAGFGAVAWYHSAVRLRDNSFSGTDAGPLRLAIGSVHTERFPLSVWGPGLPGLIPGLLVSAIALALVAGVRLAVGPLVRRRAGLALAAAAPHRGAVAILLYGFAIQSFHMLEHGIQVVQVYAIDGELRAGLLGRWIDVEWVHFVYNLTVLTFMWGFWRAW
jgi:nitrous oxidase accessory protein NosD